MFFYQEGSLELVCSQRIVYTRLCGFALFYWSPTEPFLLTGVVATQSSSPKVVKSLLPRPFRGEKIVKIYFAHPGIRFMSLKIKMYGGLSWWKNKKIMNESSQMWEAVLLVLFDPHSCCLANTWWMSKCLLSNSLKAFIETWTWRKKQVLVPIIQLKDE